MSFMDKTKTATSTSYTYNKTKPNNYGWICPVCGRGVAPDQKYCNCKPQVYPIYPTYPVYPYWWYQTICNTSDISNLKSAYTTTGTLTVEV